MKLNQVVEHEAVQIKKHKSDNQVWEHFNSDKNDKLSSQNTSDDVSVVQNFKIFLAIMHPDSFSSFPVILLQSFVF